MVTAWDRPALYYPYMTIRDVNWLKATLLAFREVRRMVPDVGEPMDSPEVQLFARAELPNGRKLLENEIVGKTSAAEAQQRLTQRIEMRLEEAKRRFSIEATEREFGERKVFTIQRYKFLHEVLGTLERHGLAWTESRDDWWVGVHPRLGEAIMSVIAIAIAEQKGLAIVTPSPEIHYGVGWRDEEAAFEALFAGPETAPPRPDALAGTADELTQVVLRTTFDVSSLSPEQVIELVQGGKDLLALKREIAQLADAIPPMRDPGERQRVLHQYAENVRESWESYKVTLPKYAQSLIGKTVGEEGLDLAKSVMPAAGLALASGATAATVGVLHAAFPGLVVAVLWHAVGTLHALRKAARESPYRYLTRIERAGATMAVTGRR